MGDPFFANFFSVFDVTRDQLGLALSSRSYEGSGMVKIPDDATPVEFTKSTLDEGSLKKFIDTYLENEDNVLDAFDFDKAVERLLQ